MSRTRRPRQAPSWLGTVVVAIAVTVICLRAAAQLRHAVAPADAAPRAARAAPSAASAP